MIIRVYLDANVFISAFESHGGRADAMLAVLDAAADGRLLAFTSELTLAEILPRPLALGQSDLAAYYESIVAPRQPISAVALDRVLLLAAAGLRASYGGLKLPDAVHLATALSQGCQAFLSDDRRLPLITGLRLIPPTASSLDDLLALRS